MSSNAQKGVRNAFLQIWGGIIFNDKFFYYKVKFILKILIIYIMNMYFLALLLAFIDTYYSHKLIPKDYKNSKTLLLLIFLISFYIILLILSYVNSLI